MEGWITIWTIVFFASITVFSLMAIWVVIFGAFDIKRMLADMSNPEEPPKE